MTTDKVYIVTRGEYDDHRIDSVWSTLEAAEAELRNGDRGQVTEWVVDAGFIAGQRWVYEQQERIRTLG